MTEGYDGPTDAPANESAGNAQVDQVDQVDQVLATLEQLDSAPVEEHVAVFGSAHERLRGALVDAADAGDDPAS